MKYDLIGDIHGHADELEALLQHMGYSHVDGCYRHPERVVIFLGDFIDRGPKQRDVLRIVMAMVRQGGSLAVMGNHEFNALAFHTPHPTEKNQWLRPRTDKNIGQHTAFLLEYLDNDMAEELAGVLDFFHSLPLWLELDGLRAIHACWSPSHIEKLKSPILTGDMLLQACTEGSDAHSAIDALLNGTAHKLTDGRYFNDRRGDRRTDVRLKWWVKEDSRLCDVVMPPGTLDGSGVENHILKTADMLGYSNTQVPLFIGHYWMPGKSPPTLLTDNMACLDYSVVKDGKLVAYRWGGERVLTNSHFTYVG